MTRSIGSAGFVVALAAALACAQAAPDVGARGDAACRGDLRASFDLVKANYAGYADKVERYGADALARAQADALRALDSAAAKPCEEIIGGWLRALHDGHVQVLSQDGKTQVVGKEFPVTPAEIAALRTVDRTPKLEILSDDTVWIRVPHFHARHRAPLERLIEEQRSAILARPELIIDVRGNTGGGDGTYRALAELVYTRPVPSVGVDALSTPGNIAGWESVRALPDMPAEVRAEIDTLVRDMREHPGVWVQSSADRVITHDAVLPNPVRVAVLIDGLCASACEQFLLEARASDKVRLFGAPTAGVLDYSNVLPHPLPSGRTLLLASTRSRRIPAQAIDDTGIAPDVAMDPALFDGPTRADALARVLRELRAAR